MPAVAVSVCQSCGVTDERTLVERHIVTTMTPCSCGGHMQVSRVFYDRRISHQPVPHGRRAQDNGPGATGNRPRPT